MLPLSLAFRHSSNRQLNRFPASLIAISVVVLVAKLIDEGDGDCRRRRQRGERQWRRMWIIRAMLLFFYHSVNSVLFCLFVRVHE